MKSFSVLFFLCGFILVGGFAWSAPMLVVDQTEFDFGTVAQGEAVRHNFVFTNTGDMPLQVEKVRSSCGCTAALVSTGTLQPGDSGELQTRFDSSRFRGEVSKTVYLYTNDPLVPVAQLIVKGQVRELLTLAPRQVQFGQVLNGQTVEARVTVTNHTDEDFVFSPVKVTTPELRAEIDGRLQAGESGEMRVFLKPKPGQNRFSGYVMLRTESDDPHELRLPVYATVGK